MRGLYLTNNPLWAGVTGWIAMVNLFNLLPILPLDGGRIFHSISFSFSQKTGFVVNGIGMFLMAYLSSKIGLGLFAFLFIISGLEIFFEILNLCEIKTLNLKFSIIKEIFPALKQEELISILNENIKLKNQVKKLHSKILWDDIGQIYNDLNIFINSTNETNTNGFFIWERGLNHSAMNKNELITHQHHITAHILNFLDYDKNIYNLFQNPMNRRKIAYSIIAYFTVAGLLYCLLYFTKHIPGSHAAFMIFKG